MNKKKLIIAAVLVIAIIIFVWCLSSSSDQPKASDKNVVESVESTEVSESKVIDDGVELVAPELVEVPNQENKPVELVELEIGINENQSNIKNNEIIENITQLVGSGFLKEAKAEAEFSLKNSTTTKVIKVEVLESSIKTR